MNKNLNEKLKLYTWNEVSKHNKKEDLWIIIDGIVYDITKWVPLHPGGEDILLLSAGRDVTNLFESYHPMSDKPMSMIKNYEIGYVSSNEHPRYVEKSEFYQTLKLKVRQHFEMTQQDHKMSVDVFTRLTLVYVVMFVMYYLSMFSFKNFWINCVLAIFYGLSTSWFSIHMMHDACHTAITHNPMVWKIMGASFDILVGASFFSWRHQHVIGHHLYTNVRNADPDLGQGEIDFRIITPFQQRSWYHKYQHIYAPILYGFYAFKYRFQDHEIFTKKSNGPIRYSPMTSFDVSVYITGKLVFLLTRFVLPLIYNHSFSNLIVYFLISELVLGWYLALSFQVSHIAEDIVFLATHDNGVNIVNEQQVNNNMMDGASNNANEQPVSFNEDWAILQVQTTQDYAHDSVLSNFFSGGLNHQVVHHLFPTFSQSVYPQIVPILKKVCLQYNIKYHIKPTFKDAMMSHINYLYKMGNDEDYVRQPISSSTSTKNTTSKSFPLKND